MILDLQLTDDQQDALAALALDHQQEPDELLRDYVCALLDACWWSQIADLDEEQEA